MKTFKISMLALLLMMGKFALAQQVKTPEERASYQTVKLAEKLGLTDDQQKSVYTIALQHVQQQDADRAKYQGDRERMRNARKQNMNNYDAGLEQILTADQKTKYEQLKAQQQAQHYHGSGSRGGIE